MQIHIFEVAIAMIVAVTIKPTYSNGKLHQII